MAIQALNLGGRDWYTPAGQDEKNATRFQIRGLTGSEQAELAPFIHEMGLAANYVMPARAVALLLDAGLLGWENFNDEAGPVPFSQNPRDNQDRLPYELQTELGREIWTRTVMAIGLKKK